MTHYDTYEIHTCHDKCQHIACVLRRELTAVTKQRDEAREDAATWKSLFSAMERAGAEQSRRADENQLCKSTTPTQTEPK